MRVVIADGAINFSGEMHSGDIFHGAFEAVNNIRHFFAERRWRCGLAVCAGKHRQGSVIVREIAQALDDRFDRRQHHVRAGVVQHQRVGEVINIFGSARKMNKFRRGECFGNRAQLAFQPIFERLNIVIGLRFNDLNRFGIRLRKIVDDAVNRLNSRVAKRRNLLQRRCGAERFEPLDFNAQAIAN